MNSLRVGVALLALACLAAAGEEDSKRNVYTNNNYQVVPLVIVGEGWSQQIVVTCISSVANLGCVGNVSFFGKDGKAWPVELLDREVDSSYAYVLVPGQVAVFETTVNYDPQTLGWAFIGDTQTTLSSVYVQSIWRNQDPNQARPDFMTSSVGSFPSFNPAITSVYFDSTGSRYAGVMILFSDFCTTNCDALQPAVFRGRAFDTQGNLLATKEFPLKMGEQNWFCLECEMPEVVNHKGTFIVDIPQFDANLSGTPILCAFSLQFAPNGAFTAINGFEH